MGMMPLDTILCAVAFILVLATALLLFRLFRSTPTFAGADGRTLQRLQDKEEFKFLRGRLSQARIRQLQAERRAILRRYVRGLACDFNRLYHALRLSLVESETDRPDLAAELAHQRLLFYRNVLLVEFRLLLNACGVDRTPTLHLVRRIEMIHARLCELAPAAEWTIAAVSA